MSGCRAEMVNTVFNVRVTDKQGKEIMNKKVQALPTGFMELWLPRNKNLTLAIDHKGKKAVKKITTTPGSNTCITDMKLM